MLHKQEVSKVRNISGVSIFSIPEDKDMKDKPVSLNPIVDTDTSNQNIVNNSTLTKQKKVHPEVRRI